MKKLILMVVALMSYVAVSAQSDVVADFNKGNEEFKAKNFAAAIELFENVILNGEEEEDDAAVQSVANAKKLLPVAYMQSGIKAIGGKNYEEALTALNTAVSKAKMYNNPKVAQAANNAIAKVYQVQGGEMFNAENYAGAAEVFAKGYAANKRNTDLAMLLAESYFKQDLYNDGMKICSEVMALPNSPLFEKGKAEAKQKMNLYTNNKIATLQQANDFDGIIAMAEGLDNQALAQKITVQAYLLKKDYDKVIELGEAAAEAQIDEEDKSAVYFQLGTAYNAKEMKDKAIAALSKVTAGPSVEAAKAAIAGLTAPAN
ncbi:MAG: hypothetical protein IKM03_02250 [Alistipes sp.]|nr:hypothetical protein [Alistipes sp.]